MQLSAGAAALWILFLFYEALFDDSVVIEFISVPKVLSDEGITSEIASTRLRDEINLAVHIANTTIRPREVLEKFEEPDVVIPSVGLSARTVAVYLGKLFGIKRKGMTISGEFTTEKGGLSLRLRNAGAVFFVGETGAQQHDPDELLVEAAQALLEIAQPYVLASYFYETKKQEKSLVILNRIIATAPPGDEQIARAHGLRGNIAVDEKRFDEAASEYNLAIKLNPGLVFAHADLAYMLNQLGRKCEALDEYRKATLINNKSAKLHSNLGTLLSDTGHPTDAMAEYNLAIWLDPTLSEAHFNKGNLLVDLNHPVDAVEEYKTAIALDATRSTYYNNFGTLLWRLGRVTDAVHEIETSIRLDPKNAVAHNNLGLYWDKIGNREEAARAEFAAAIQNDPTFAAPHGNLSVLLLRRGQPQDAQSERQTYENLIKQAQSSNKDLKCGSR